MDIVFYMNAYWGMYRNLGSCTWGAIYTCIYIHTYSPTALYRFLASGILNILKLSEAVLAFFFDIAVWGE